MPTPVIGHDPGAKRVSACGLGTDSLSVATPAPFHERYSSTPEPATPPRLLARAKTGSLVEPAAWVTMR